MARIRAIFLFVALLFLTDGIVSQSDLRSALAAIDRRQKELADYEEQQQYGFNPYAQSDELAFLNNAADGRLYEKDYLDDESYEPLSKRFTSAFREKLEEDRDRQMEEFAKNLYNNLETNGMPSGLDKNYLKELWERYYGNDINIANTGSNRLYYTPYGMDNISPRKRGRYADIDNEPIYSLHHHIPRSGDSDYQRNHLRNYNFRGSTFNEPRPTYKGSKRFLVIKRSDSFPKDQNRSFNKQTDPKVEKDLSNIFGNDQKTDGVKSQVSEATLLTTPKLESGKNNESSPSRKIEKKDRPKMDSNKETDLNKEVFEPVAPQNKKPLQLKKKSIDWSDYFGLDRRKKSDPNNGLDKEWLMERYHKAVSITAKKRNAELTLQSFRKHETPVLKKDDDSREKEEQRINEMDRTLEKLEDEIVGDALKYTGAHQDDVDSKEIQQVKDNIISRLAQAYNIEKMRNALEEYKIEIEKARKEVEKSKLDDKLFADYTTEEKRVAVPRKQAIDESRETAETDNNIKCTTSDDCYEQNYKTPSDVLDTHFSSLECPSIQRACFDVSSIVGHYGHVFEVACSIHQMCLLCSNNSWFSPTRQCNMLFITKAFELCLGKEECKKEARRSLKYLLDINKSLQAQTPLTDECELQCPDIDVLSK